MDNDDLFAAYFVLTCVLVLYFLQPDLTALVNALP